jgi:hypothetical protein
MLYNNRGESYHKQETPAQMSRRSCLLVCKSSLFNSINHGFESLWVVHG